MRGHKIKEITKIHKIIIMGNYYELLSTICPAVSVIRTLCVIA